MPLKNASDMNFCHLRALFVNTIFENGGVENSTPGCSNGTFTFSKPSLRSPILSAKAMASFNIWSAFASFLSLCRAYPASSSAFTNDLNV